MLEHARNNAGADKFREFIGSAKAAPIIKYFGL
jgi:hypothetical protein